MSEKEWYKKWFNTPYYHLLYKKRDEREAAFFLDELIGFLHAEPGARILDLASGKGRHSIYLHKKGFEVTGLDLSHYNIEFARKFEAPRLKFIEHDMRQPLQGLVFDYVFNLFTSLGYFNSEDEDTQIIRNAKRCLKPGGILVIDYFNPDKPFPGFDQPFTKEVDGVLFHVKRKKEAGCIIKHIEVKDGENIRHFSERVRVYNLPRFKQIVEEAGLTLLHTFGSYALKPYDPNESERLILIIKNPG